MQDDIQIVKYRDEFAEAFDRLNRDWLVRYGLLEQPDEVMLRAPREEIVERGGEVFFALRNSEVVGTAAAIWEGEDTVELAKLGVAASARGHGLGRDLTLAVIEFARQHGAKRVALVSSTKLKTAVRLYESVGFQHRPLPPDVGYATADVYMEMELDS
jgi:GNAT superfamily N-acetyltransferase